MKVKPQVFEAALTAQPVSTVHKWGWDWDKDQLQSAVGLLVFPATGSLAKNYKLL